MIVTLCVHMWRITLCTINEMSFKIKVYAKKFGVFNNSNKNTSERKSKTVPCRVTVGLNKIIRT